METNTFKLLESTTIKTLHAHSFTRSSTQASLVLTDLLSRYLSLLTSTCAQYAQHAGRTNLTARDALFALDEMGVNVDELSDYASVEGMELGRYAQQRTARRVEELNELKGQSCLVKYSRCLPISLFLLILSGPTGGSPVVTRGNSVGICSITRHPSR